MEDLQSILEKINREGIEKAEATARDIIAQAEARAAKLIQDAKEQAARTKEESEKAATAASERAAESIRQAARDVIICVKDSITNILDQLLAHNVNKALSDEKTAVELVRSALQNLTGPGKIVCGEQLAQALSAQAASLGSFTVTTDASVGAGFSVQTEGGRIEHSFTEKAIIAELAKRLRPDLAALLK